MAKSHDGKNYEKTATLVRETREAKKISQDALSQMLGEHRTFVQKVEYMERRIDVIEFYRFAKVLQIDPIELFTKLVQMLEAEPEKLQPIN